MNINKLKMSNFLVKGKLFNSVTTYLLSSYYEPGWIAFWELKGEQKPSSCPQRVDSLVEETDLNCINRNHIVKVRFQVL